MFRCLESRLSARFIFGAKKPTNFIIFLFSRDEDIQNIYRNQNHGERLLNELGCRFCTTGVLCKILEECGLYSILLLFRKPGKIYKTLIRRDKVDKMEKNDR